VGFLAMSPWPLVMVAALLGAGPAAGLDELQPFGATSPEDLRPRIIENEDRILILTPAALYRFQPNSETWTTTTAADGLPGAPLGGFSVADANLWIGGKRACVSDLRFDDWQCYGPGEGYPGRLVFDVDADADYAYAGTDAGAARFDQFILEWEPLPGPEGVPLGPVADVAVGDQYAWFALEHGVAEYRKDAESFRIDERLGHLHSPRVLALREGTGVLYAVTDAGIARYDTDLHTWTSYLPGVDLPDARIHQLVQQGNDLWLGTDDGLWSFLAESGIWRRDDSNNEMPGRRVRSVAVAPDRFWVVTEQAFAVYERTTGRWIDFTTSVPMAPAEVHELAWLGETLVLLGDERIVYGLSQGQDNPSLFSYRSREILESALADADPAQAGWRVGLDEAGLGVETPGGADLHLKGGATIFVEDDDSAAGTTGLGDLATETRLDLLLTGQVSEDRTLSGFYDSTDPDNAAYQLTFRGRRTDVLRTVSVGEIDMTPFNTDLTPGTGLRGGRVRAELGERLAGSRRRRVAADAWVGRRRTKPGRDVFLGGNQLVETSTRDVDYAAGAVFPLPAAWTAADLREASVYRDDKDDLSDNANTIHGELAGVAGAWDRLRPNVDYVIGPRGDSLVLAAALAADHALVAVHNTGAPPGAEAEIELTHLALRNHYWIAMDPVPGSLAVALVDTNGAIADVSGTPYLESFGLDTDGDGLVDPHRFSPITGMLALPAAQPFPDEVYADPSTNVYTFNYSYQATRNTYQLGHRDLVPGSERIIIDRELLQAGVDYSLIHTSGLFVLFEHVLLDEDSVIEVEYLYEVGLRASSNDDEDDSMISAAQVGISPSDQVYAGAGATRWTDADGSDVTTADLNARLEWKDDRYLLRLTPEMAVSQTAASAGGGSANENPGRASSLGVQGRYRGLELSARHRDLGADYRSFEDRRTLLGRLREQSRARGLWNVNQQLQAEIEWDRSASDQVAAGDVFAAGTQTEPGTGRGEESTLMGTVRWRRSGWPNLEVKRGRVDIDAAGASREKWVSRAELELSPDRRRLAALGIRRLWLRAFFQRSDRDFATDDEDSAGIPRVDGGLRRSTNHAFVRLNGSAGNPLSWNVAFEDSRTFQSGSATARDLRRFQEVDATLQSQPHASLDAYLRYEADRNLFWYPGGGSGGFATNRVLLTTMHFYPGRLSKQLSRLSLRWDIGVTDNENGEPGIAQPATGNLFGAADAVSRRNRSRSDVFETRVQLFSRVRLIERWQMESGSLVQEGLTTDSDSRQLESRLEIRPRGGLVTVRAIGSDSESFFNRLERRRFFGQWDQTWGGGLLTFVALEAQRNDSWTGQVGQRENLWSPQARITWRRERWQLDANLGGSLTWSSAEDRSPGVTAGSDNSRKQALTATVSVRPQRNFSVKLQYGWSRSRDDGAAWITDHDIRLRLQIRG